MSRITILKYIPLTVAAAMLGLVLFACSTPSARDQTISLQTISAFEPSRYLGKWYEIARLPNFFEKNCVGVTAEYALRDDGQISVKNSCYKDTLKGPLKIANGLARIESIGKLSVTFTPYLPLPRGDYWILGLQDYQIAVIGNPRGKTAWILARNPKLSQAERAWADQILTDAGYDPLKLYNVPQ